MKRICCWILVFVSIMTIAFSVTAVVSSAEPLTASDYAINDLLEHFPFENIPYSYISSGNSYSSSIDYSDALLLQDASIFSPELAKSSVALAMAAYSSSNVNSDYSRPNVNSLLQNMGFEAYDNTYVYSRSANDLTLEDNDYVAYTVAVKELIHPYTNETYIIYAVPIQGTTANAEWFSNFNLGTGSEHEGFQKASKEVYQTLKCYFSIDGAMDADHRIVWLTGHSRGAACANLVAGWLSRDDEQYTTMENVYGYTFACPAVSLYADTTLHNIYNFNNDGDLISKIPMANWQYKRYGQDITLDNDSLHFDNLKQRYKSVTGQTYAGMQTGTSYDTLLTNILGNNRDVYYESSFLQLVLAIAGWGLGGKNDAEFGEVLAKYLDDNSADIVFEALKSYVGSKTDLDEIYSFLKTVLTDKDGLAEWASSAYSATYGMTEEQFTQYLSSNISKIAKLEDASGVGIKTPDSLLLAHNELLNDSSKIEKVTDCIQAANDLLFDGNGNVMNKITHGHCQATYVLWINAMFYGDRGWYNNSSITNVQIPNSVNSIGSNAFYYCRSLKTLILPEKPIQLGSSAFGLCTELSEVTLPIDTDYSMNPFEGTYNVSKIYYTYGATGIMPDYSSNTYSNTLQSRSIGTSTTVILAEGITRIGNYGFYNSSYL